MKRLIALAVVALASAPLLADHDRPPTAEERARIMQALEAMGYKSVGEIEVEGTRIEVDDAIGADGKRYDLELDATTLKLIHKELDHD
jgi:hypothetical protein